MSIKGILAEQFPTAEAIGAATAEALEQVSNAVDNIDTNTSINNTASSTGLLSQKLSHIINQLEALQSSSGSSNSVVKSVQRGTLSFTSETATATIKAVDVNKAIVIHGGSSYYGGYGNASYSGNWDARLTLKNSTTVEATVGYYNKSYTGPTTWQVIEFY